LTAGIARWTILGCVGLVACGSDPVGDDGGPREPLRTLAAAHGLGIGSAADRGLGLSGVEGETFRALLAGEFDVLTPENAMKHERLRPSRTAYDFAGADSVVVFAEAHAMRVRGHTLAWHRQLAPWLVSGTWTRDEALTLLKEHIETVVGRYAGRVAAWDVVNEALADDGSLRSGFWLDHIGREYVDSAFRWARAVDAGAVLFYNDYGLEWAGLKNDSAYALLSGLLQSGAPVDGIGFQAHFEVGKVPSSDVLRASFDRFASLGVAVHVTELDVRVPLPASSEDLDQQAQDYARVVEACLGAAACHMVVMWGFTDAESWIPATFPGFGEAHIFDAAYRPKPAYWALHRLLE